MIAILFPVFVILLFVGVPVTIAIGASVIVAFLFSDFITSLYILPQQLLDGVSKPSLVAIPFFIMAGNLMNVTGMTDRIFNFANALVGHFRAGLAQVNVLSSMIFAGISGAAIADCAGLGAVEIKAMKERGYSAEFSAAITICSAVIGPLIPPSIALIVYAFLAQQSVERMFLAGVVPGVLVGVILMIFNRVIAIRREFPMQPRATAREVMRTGVDGILAIAAPVIIVVSILTGWVTPTEVGVLACLYAICLGICVYRTLSWAKFWEALTETMYMSAVLMMIIGFSTAVAWLLAIELIPQQLANAITSFTDSRTVFLIILLICLLLVGMVVDGLVALLLLVPVLLPVVDAYGVDRVHFGLIMQLGVLIGLATPPMGLGLYIMVEVGKVSFEKVSYAVLPFLIPLILALILITFIPELVLWLPNLVLGEDISIIGK